MDILTILLAVVISLVVGFFAGRMMGQLRGDDTDGQEEAPADPGVLIVEKDIRNGKTSVRLGGQVFTEHDSFDPRTESGLKNLLHDLKTWFEEDAVEKPAASDRGSEVQVTHHIEHEADEEEKSRGSVGGFLANALRADIRSPDLTPKSVAAQVDAILQENIAGTPLAEKGIRLMEFPDKGMVVLIGMEKYDGVEEVPYDDIRSVIKQAVSTWEDRMLKKD